jgi:alpha-ketoglutarate-dependent taurine dioxygenase
MMKTIKLNGFGSLGVEVDLDLKTATDDEIKAFGHIVADQLVVVVDRKNCTLPAERLNYIAKTFGDPFGGIETKQSVYELVETKKKNQELKLEDLQVLKELKKIRQGLESYDGQIWVTGKKDDDGDYLGMFADGELDWHSDRQGTGNFCPCIGLMAVEGTEGTCTEFLQTADAYEKLSHADQKFIDELVAIHSYTPGKIAPGLNKAQDNIVRMNMCPVDLSEVPVACNSTTGRKGIRLSYNTIVGFKNYSEKDTQGIIDFMINTFLKDEYVYHHDWRDGDIVWMDQTITVHRRPTKDCSKRVLIRQTCNFDNLLGKGTQGLQNLGYEVPGIIKDGKMLSKDEFNHTVKFTRVY